MILGIHDLATFVAGTVFIVLLPGPNSLHVMAVASRRGVAAGYRGAMGVFLGDTVLMVMSATGVASLMNTVPALFVAMKAVGAAYLAWLGVKLLRAARQGGWPRPPCTEGPRRRAPARRQRSVARATTAPPPCGGPNMACTGRSSGST